MLFEYLLYYFKILENNVRLLNKGSKLDSWLFILVDISILGFFGILYYFYQKRRIIRISLEDIQENLEDFRLKLNEYNDEMKHSDVYSNLQEFTDSFEANFQSEDLLGFIKIQNDSVILNKDLEEFYTLICRQIHDHLGAK